MPNGKIIQKYNNVPKQHPEVIILKLLVLSVILILPLAFMFFDFSKVRLVYKNNVNMRQGGNINKEKTSNFEAPLPTSSNGDLSAVSLEKIDTLFNNLK